MYRDITTTPAELLPVLVRSKNYQLSFLNVLLLGKQMMSV